MSIEWAKAQAFMRDIVKPAIEIPDLLDQAAEWIAEHLDPEDVFPDEALRMWAEANGFIQDTQS